MSRAFVYYMTIDGGLVEEVRLDNIAADDLPRVGTAGGGVPAYVVIDQYGRVASYTVAPPLGFTVGGKTIQLSDTKTLTTSDTELVLSSTGDSFGAIELHMQNRTGQAGPLFKNVTLNVLDFAFQGASSSARTLRYAGDSSFTLVGSTPEFQFGQGSSSGCSFLTADTQAGFVRQNAGQTVVAGWWNNTATVVGRPQAQARTTWIDPTDATRTSQLDIGTYYTSTFQSGLRITSGAATWTVYLANATASFSSDGTASLASGAFVVDTGGGLTAAGGAVGFGTDGAITATGPITPGSLADIDAPSGSIYFSTTASKLVFKDSGGTVHALY